MALRIVHGTMLDMSGAPVVGQPVICTLSSPVATTSLDVVVPLQQEQLTDVNGLFVFSLFAQADLTLAGVTVSTTYSISLSHSGVAFAIVVPSGAYPGGHPTYFDIVADGLIVAMPAPYPVQVVTGPPGPPGSGASLTIANTWTAAQTLPVIDVGSQVYNAKAYGVAWNNSTDDATALNALITTVNGSAGGGGTILLPAGTGIVGATINLKSNVRLQGVSQSSTILKLKTAANVDVCSSAGTQTGYEICDLTIDGNKANQTTAGTGVTLVTDTYCSVRRVTVQNTFGRGIYDYHGTDNTITDCTVINSGKTATVDLTGSSICSTTSVRPIIKGNRVINSNDAGIYVGASYPEVTGNIVSTCHFIGIAASASMHGNITGNNVNGCGDNGIDTGTATQMNVSGNSISNVKYGIDADLTSLGAVTAADLTIFGNQIDTCSADGIIVNGPTAYGITNVVISGNTIDTTQNDGIQIASVSHSIVSGNVVRNPSRAALGFVGISVYGNTAGSTHNLISGNRVFETAVFQAYGITNEGTNNDYNTYTNNDVRTCGQAFVILAALGAHDQVRGNMGDAVFWLIQYLNLTAPAFPATTATYTNATAYDLYAHILNGTSAMTTVVNGNTGPAIIASTHQTIFIPAGGTFVPTYGGGSPAWSFQGN